MPAPVSQRPAPGRRSRPCLTGAAQASIPSSSSCTNFSVFILFFFSFFLSSGGFLHFHHLYPRAGFPPFLLLHPVCTQMLTSCSLHNCRLCASRKAKLLCLLPGPAALRTAPLCGEQQQSQAPTIPRARPNPNPQLCKALVGSVLGGSRPRAGCRVLLLPLCPTDPLAETCSGSHRFAYFSNSGHIVHICLSQRLLIFSLPLFPAPVWGESLPY